MITNFEEETLELSEYEKETIVPWLIKGFSKRTKDNPIKARDIVLSCNKVLESTGSSYRITQPRLRKISNYIRTNGLLPLIATSKGYYSSTDKQEIRDQIESLTQRANSIQRSADGLLKFLKNE